MIPAHTALYSRLSPAQAQFVTARLLERNLLDAEQVLVDLPESALEAVDGEQLARWCADLSHAQVVLSLADSPEEIALTAMEILIERPIYMCARGETGFPMTDILGRPMPLPLGQRRTPEAESRARLTAAAAEALLHPPESDPATTEPAPPPPVLEVPANYKRPIYNLRARRDPRILVEMKPNPKRPGSAAHQRYGLYLLGRPIEESIAVGVTRADVRWDERQGFITLQMPPKA